MKAQKELEIQLQLSCNCSLSIWHYRNLLSTKEFMLLQKASPMSLHGTTASLDLAKNNPQVLFIDPIGLPTLKFSIKDQA